MRIFAFASFILAAFAGPAGALILYTQAESFVASHDIGYAAIRSYNSLLEGLDYPDEWAEYQISAPAYGTYTIRMRCWGEIGVPYHLRLVTYPVTGEDIQTIDISFTGLMVEDVCT